MEDFKSTTEPLLKACDFCEARVASSHHILPIGAPTTISCLINYLVMELASRYGEDLKMRQEKLPQSYWENDVLFSMKNLKQEEEGD